MPSTRKRSNSPSKKTARRRSKTPSPGKGATKEKIEVYYLAKAYKTLKGSPLARFVKNVKKTARQSKSRRSMSRSKSRSKSGSKSK